MTDSEVSIDPEVLAQVIGDLERTRDRIRSQVSPLRHRFTAHDVPTTHLDRLADAADRIDQVVPDLHEREQQAREINRSSPGMGGTVSLPRDITTSAQSTAYPGESSSDFGTRANSDGSTTIDFDASPFAGAEAEGTATAEVDPPLLSIGGLKSVGGKALGWLGDRADDLKNLVSDAWDNLTAELTKLWQDAAAWWDDLSTRIGGWIDDKLAVVRQWIGKFADIIRGLAWVLRIVGWVLVVVGVVLFIVGLVLDATGIGAIAGLPTGAAALEIANIGFLLVGAADTLDLLADWGEGKIDGKQLFQALAGEVALGVLSALGLGILGKGLQKLLKHLPAGVKKWFADLIERIFKRSRPRPGHAPGDPDFPLRGGTAANPRRYTYRSPALKFKDHAKPTDDDLAFIDPKANYPVGSEEHLLQTWQLYLARKVREGKPPLSWEKWRNGYISNTANKAKGDAYEDAFWGDHDFSESDGWRHDETPVRIDGPNGSTSRKFDVYDPENKIAYELKSGNDGPNTSQIGRDAEFVQAGWDIRYILSKEPTATQKQAMERAGIKWEVWVGEGTPVG